MEIVEIVTKIALAIGAIYGAVKGIHALVRWLRRWKIIRLEEFKRLTAIEAKQYQPAIEQMMRESAKLAEETDATLEKTSKLLESNSDRTWRAWNKK